MLYFSISVFILGGLHRQMIYNKYLLLSLRSPLNNLLSRAREEVAERCLRPPGPSILEFDPDVLATRKTEPDLEHGLDARGGWWSQTRGVVLFINATFADF